MTSHLDDLNQLRAITIEQRRKLAKELAGHSERRGDSRKLFLELQTTIEAIDRAIRDEREAAGPWPSNATR
jgi:hypothetical protein